MNVISNEEFNKSVKNAQEFVLVDFFATWCGPCRMLAPELEEACEEKKVECYKIDIDKDSDLARAHGVLAVPTVFAYKNGQPVAHFSGFRTKEEIIEFIEEHND